MSDVDEEKVKHLVAEFMKTQQPSYQKGEADELCKLADNFLQTSPQKFKPKDKVRWKAKLKNKKYPKEDQIAVVIEQLEKPIMEKERDSGSSYFNEPLDLVLGVLDDDGDFMIYHYDSRRFERVE